MVFFKAHFYNKTQSVSFIAFLWARSWSHQSPEKSAWKQLRELRNLTVGHPIETIRKQRRKRAFITRVSLESSGFDYQVWHQGTGNTSFEHADLSALYAAYKKEAASYLSKIVATLSRVVDIS